MSSFGRPGEGEVAQRLGVDREDRAGRAELGAHVADRRAVEGRRAPDLRASTTGTSAIAAITSCTNTSNPSVMLAPGCWPARRRNAGLKAQPWVKTSLRPEVRVVTDYLDRAGLTEPLEELGFNLVGYGCTTCIGNSGPLPERSARRSTRATSSVCGALAATATSRAASTRDVRANYLASPPLVVAYALAGTMDVDLPTIRSAMARTASRSTSRTSGPPSRRSRRRVEESVQSDMFRKQLRRGLRRRRALERPRRARRATATRGTRTRPTCGSRRTSRACRRSPTPVERHRRRARAGAARRQRHHRPHLARRARSRRTAPPGPTSRSTACSSATSTPTARAAATTR